MERATRSKKPPLQPFVDNVDKIGRKRVSREPTSTINPTYALEYYNQSEIHGHHQNVRPKSVVHTRNENSFQSIKRDGAYALSLADTRPGIQETFVRQTGAIPKHQAAIEYSRAMPTYNQDHEKSIRRELVHMPLIDDQVYGYKVKTLSRHSASRQSLVSSPSVFQSMIEENELQKSQEEKKLRELRLNIMKEEAKLCEQKINERSQHAEKLKSMMNERSHMGSVYSLNEEHIEVEPSAHEKVNHWMGQNQCAPSLRSCQSFDDRRYRQTTEPTNNQVMFEAFKALQVRNVKDLPTFNGDLLEWPNFKAEFFRSTRESNIRESDNLRRLNKALSGKARDAVKALLNSPSNIELIMELLENNFGQSEWVIMTLLERARQFSQIKDGCVDSFREFYSNVIGIINAIKNAGGEMYLISPELMATLVDKLPAFSKNVWAHHKVNILSRQRCVSVVDFGEWLSIELKAQYANYNPFAKKINTSSTVSQNKSHPNQPHSKPVQKGSATLLVNTENKSESTSEAKENDKKPQRGCLICGSNSHKSALECADFKKLALDDRRQRARDVNLCFVCLYPRHGKCNKKELRCSKCNSNHHDLLHKDYEPKKKPEEKKTSEVCMTHSTATNCLLRVGKVNLRGPGGVVQAFALFDDGSTASMIDKSIADNLKLVGRKSPITYKWTNGVVRFDPESTIVDMEIADVGKKFHRFKNVRTSTCLELPTQKIDVEKVVRLYPNIDKDLLNKIREAKPVVLVGSNNAGLTVPTFNQQYKADGLQLTRCRLGWTVHGVVETSEDTLKPEVDVLFHDTASDDEVELADLIRQQYRLETFGTVEKEKLSEDDTRALDMMRSTLRKVEDRFEIGQIYRFPGMPMPTKASKAVATKRLLFVERRMDQSEKFAQAYEDKIADYLQKGYARKLQGDEVVPTDRTFYLPHFGVYNPNKPGKFRWVMDAKAKCGSYSLNDLLLQGPDFVPSLPSVIWRARLKKIAFVADIAEMFHQVKIRREDQESQRFLYRGMRRDKEPDEYIMQVMIFGAVSSPSMAQFVKNENARMMEEANPGVSRSIQQQHYVDDCFDCADSVRDAVDLIQRIDKVHQSGGFQLMKYMSNSPEVMAEIPDLKKCPDVDQPAHRVLGITWDVKSDKFIFPLEFPKFADIAADAPTMKKFLSFIMSIFDPIGFLLPLTVKLKIIYQDLWRLDNRWEKPIPPSLFEKFKEWLSEAKMIQVVSVPRWYFPGAPTFTEAQLHTFSDAGDKAMAACVFLRLGTDDGRVFVSLIQGKSKIAPLKHVTVPRLELQAATIACEVADTVEKELGITIAGKHFWTDSTIVLSWINTKEKLGQFIGPRITKIQELSQVKDWHWIQSELNVADMATKHHDNVNLKETSPWLKGPAFLYKAEKDWPNNPTPSFSQEESVHFQIEMHQEATILVNLEATNPELFCLPDVNAFSRYSNLIRSTTLILKMADIAKKREWNRVESQRKAENLWIRRIQLEAFRDELLDLSKSGTVKVSSDIYRLSPILHDGIIRFGGRIYGGAMTFDERNPIILPNSHQFVKLLVRYYHQKNLHTGIEAVINNLRQRYWIVRCRSLVKKVFRECNLCRLKTAVPTPVQMGYLPEERVQAHVHPFTFAGADHFGPMYVTEGRKRIKVWGLLFTCLTTRAIDIQLVSSLDTSTTIMAIMRFCNLRGQPKKIFSDQGTSFVGANRELKEAIQGIDNKAIAEDLARRKNIEWIFNPPGAPHFGAIWERQIRTVKTSLQRILTEQAPPREVLETLMSEVVNTVNNRPLTQVSVDPSEPSALTPNGLLLLRNNDTSYQVEFHERDVPNKRHWKNAHFLADQWWRRWIKEYRPTLIQRTKWFDNKQDPELKIGDIVYVVDENLPRGSWPKGIIERTFSGKDSKVRVADIKTEKGTYRRCFSKIAKLHLSSAPEDVVENTSLPHKS